MHRIRCSEIWGGIDSREDDVESEGITASLFSSACDGGKGGDIYYVSVCGSDMLTRIGICDVVGHGQQVSDVSSWLYDSLALRMNDPESAGILTHMNGIALSHGLTAMTTAAIVGYYTKTGELSFSYAGHPPAWVWRAQDGVWRHAEVESQEEGPSDLPLGVLLETHYNQANLPLASGDRLVVFTDGILELPDAGGTQFGDEGIADVLARSGSDSNVSEIRRALLDAAYEHGGGKLTHDDVTLVAVEVK